MGTWMIPVGYAFGVALGSLANPARTPDLTLIWFRNPDSTEHAYGIGVPNYRDALHARTRCSARCSTS